MASSRCRRHSLGRCAAAFGISDDIAPDQFLVGLAALTLVTTAAATRRPLLIVVDDTQWLDQESADALGFLARRLYADRVCVLASVRDPIADRRLFDGLPSLDLGPLSEAASVELLDTAVHGPLADHIRARLLAEARGNPLALVEFGRELTPEQLAGADQLPEPLAIDRRLEGHFLRQVGALPPPTQGFLLVAAAEPTGDASSIWRAGRELDFDEHAMAPAQAAGLLEVGPKIAFRHPLIRSAVYQGASHADRCRAHAALATASDAARDPDRRAWHRAAAVQFPDDEVAAELEDAARRARSRGSCAASAALLARAAEFTLDNEQRASRLLRAAGADLTAGSAVRAQANLARALPDIRDPLQLARARQLEAADRVPRLASWVAHERGDEGADEQDRLDDARRGASVRAAGRAARSRRGVRRDPDGGLLRRVERGVGGRGRGVARSFERPAATAPSAADLVLDAIAELIAEGYSSAGPMLREALAAVQREPKIARPSASSCTSVLGRVRTQR